VAAAVVVQRAELDKILERCVWPAAPHFCSHRAVGLVLYDVAFDL
jgi:hypothetical protein